MIQLSCHSSTSKEEVVDFVKKLIGQTVVIHYEHNMYNRWGDDDMYEVFLDKDGLEIALDIIARHDIHGVWTKEVN